MSLLKGAAAWVVLGTIAYNLGRIGSPEVVVVVVGLAVGYVLVKEAGK